MIVIVDHVTPKDEEDSKEVVVKIAESIEADITSLLFVKAHFYTHLLEPSKKTFAWEDRYIIHCSGASAMLTAHSACTCGVLIES